MSGRVPRLGGGPAVLSVADQGYFFGYTLVGTGPVSTQNITSANNAIRVFQFVLPFRITVRKIGWDMTTGIDGSHSSMGIYSADGNSLLVHSGAVATAIADQAIQVTTVTEVVLNPAAYYFAQTSTSVSVNARIWNLGSRPQNLLNAASVAERCGTAANASSGGVLPATLGTITDATGINPSMCVFVT